MVPDMPDFRFLHVADVHLDSPLRGLEVDPDAPASRIRQASREALTNLVAFAIEEAVPLVVIAGDLFDGDWQDWRTGHFLTGQLARLTREGVRVVAIRGNHDAQSVLTRTLSLPVGATLLDAGAPETVDLPHLGAAVHGQSFADRETLTNLALAYPPPRSDRVNIGLLHTAASGRDGHANYAPCSVEQLANHGYQYWALGHVHAREVLNQDPWIVFPGNLQGRHAKETGTKGATLVNVERGRVVSAEHVAFDAVRWEHLLLDVSDAQDMADICVRLHDDLKGALAGAEGRLLALRVTLAGATGAHAALMRDPGAIRDLVRSEVLAGAGSADAAWVEDVRVRTRPALDLDALCAREDALGTLAHTIEAAGISEAGAAVKEYARKLLERAPGLRDALGPDHPAVLAAAGEVTPELLTRARDLLLARLAEG